jgi:hypothetical protein
MRGTCIEILVHCLNCKYIIIVTEGRIVEHVYIVQTFCQNKEIWDPRESLHRGNLARAVSRIIQRHRPLKNSLTCDICLQHFRGWDLRRQAVNILRRRQAQIYYHEIPLTGCSGKESNTLIFLLLVSKEILPRVW